MKYILRIENLKRYFSTKYGIVKAVDGISFNVEYKEVFGLIGESGSGKSTTGHVIVGLYPPTSGKVYFEGNDISMPASKRPKNVRREIQIVFQDPASSLNPASPIRDIIMRPLLAHGIMPRKECEAFVEELLGKVGLPPEIYAHRKPRELGGGELQLVSIARAIATKPKLVILDEPTSALDVITQAKIIKLLTRLKNELGLTYIFITHDLGLVKNFASRVAVMYLGKIVEMAPTDTLFAEPLHPYTLMLLSSAPVVYREDRDVIPRRVKPVGEVPSAISPPPGCRFHTRCPYVTEQCKSVEPGLVSVDNNDNEGHLVACHMFSRS
ncbi:MAG: ABC transporter ATP-binding protein [Thermoprotei archaeon]